MANKVIYDWFSMTSKIDSPESIILRLGLDEQTWQVRSGAHGYKDKMWFESISIHYNPRQDSMPGVWLEMSGQGCRAYESFGRGDFTLLFNYVCRYPGSVSVTRLDVAYDDEDGVFDINTLCHDVWANEYVSKAQYWEVLRSSKGDTCQIGSSASDTVIRIYDKARERGFEDRHWIRLELQLRHENALGFLKLAGSIGENLAGVVFNYLRFIEPMEGDSNRWRWPIKEYWGNFLLDAVKKSVYEKPGMEYNVENLRRFVVEQAGGAVGAFIDLYGLDGLREAIESRTTRPNPKYQQLVARFKEGQGNEL